MLCPERHSIILERLRSDGRVLSADLSRILSVSEDTVRRDLRQLSEAGLLLKVHGGAVPRSSTKLQFTERTGEKPSAKRAIAHAACRLLRSGQFVLMDAGTTVLETARSMPRELAFTAATHSPLAAAALADCPEAEIILIGGRLLKRGIAAIGPDTVDAYRRMRADVCLLGVCSVHVESGLTDPTYDESLVKRAMIECATEVIVLADGAKLGTTSTFAVAPLKDIDRLITDASAPESVVESLRSVGVDVTIADERKDP